MDIEEKDEEKENHIEEKLFIKQNNTADHSTLLSKYLIDNNHNAELVQFEKERCGIVSTDLNLLTECKNNKVILDFYYDHLEWCNAFIQISIIIVSTISAFLQALQSVTTIPNIVSALIMLCISTYISLVMSISKFFKLDQRKERAHNLREKYSELHNKIRYRLDTIKAWKSEGYFHDDNIKEKIKEWNQLSAKLKTEYFTLIETKQSLYTEYEKIIDSSDRKEYENILLSKEIIQHKKKLLIQKLEDNLNNV
jgi:hypothetical protein